MAMGVVNYAARRSLALERKEAKQEGEQTTLTLGGTHAVLIPVLSSVSLLVLFYFFSAIQQLVRALCSSLQRVLIYLTACCACCVLSAETHLALGGALLCVAADLAGGVRGGKRRLLPGGASRQLAHGVAER